MTLADYADVAQLVLAIATVGGVMAALLTTRMTLREVQYDRELRRAPFLALAHGQHDVTIRPERERA